MCPFHLCDHDGQIKYAVEKRVSLPSALVELSGMETQDHYTSAGVTHGNAPPRVAINSSAPVVSDLAVPIGAIGVDGNAGSGVGADAMLTDADGGDAVVLQQQCLELEEFATTRAQSTHAQAVSGLLQLMGGIF